MHWQLAVDDPLSRVAFRELARFGIWARACLDGYWSVEVTYSDKGPWQADGILDGYAEGDLASAQRRAEAVADAILAALEVTDDN